jgi:hypothetical protein
MAELPLPPPIVDNHQWQTLGVAGWRGDEWSLRMRCDRCGLRRVLSNQHGFSYYQRDRRGNMVQVSERECSNT